MLEELNQVVEALRSENASLKGVISGLSAEKQALRQTVGDVLESNINLKSNSFLLDTKVSTLSNDLSLKDNVIDGMKKELAELKSQLISSPLSEVDVA